MVLGGIPLGTSATAALGSSPAASSRTQITLGKKSAWQSEKSRKQVPCMQNAPYTINLKHQRKHKVERSVRKHNSDLKYTLER